MKDRTAPVRATVMLAVLLFAGAACFAQGMAQGTEDALRRQREKAASSLQKGSGKRGTSPAAQDDGTQPVPRWVNRDFAYDEAAYFLGGEEAVPPEEGIFASGRGLSENAARRNALLALGNAAAFYARNGVTEVYRDGGGTVVQTERFPNVENDAQTVAVYDGGGEWHALLFLSARDMKRISSARSYPYIEVRLIEADGATARETVYVDAGF